MRTRLKALILGLAMTAASAAHAATASFFTCGTQPTIHRQPFSLISFTFRAEPPGSAIAGTLVIDIPVSELSASPFLADFKNGDHIQTCTLMVETPEPPGTAITTVTMDNLLITAITLNGNATSPTAAVAFSFQRYRGSLPSPGGVDGEGVFESGGNDPN